MFSGLTDALVPVDVLYKADGALAAVASRQVDTAVLARLLISTFIQVLAGFAAGVRLIATWTLTLEPTVGVLTGALRATAWAGRLPITVLTALVYI